MPHLTIEYTANLAEDGNFPGLVREAAVVLARQRDAGKPVFPLGGIRVRALRIDTWAIADGAADDAFVHATLKIGSGRSDTAKRQTGDDLFAAMKSHFSALYDRRYLALSLEIAEFGEAGTWKHNNIHARLKQS
jgi:5-carboxymethyl-2-hydroxymuconate isomerase